MKANNCNCGNDRDYHSDMCDKCRELADIFLWHESEKHTAAFWDCPICKEHITPDLRAHKEKHPSFLE